MLENNLHKNRGFGFMTGVMNNFSKIFKNNRQFAFTLAEVLVTITVIGAIAAMTLPNLNSHFKRIEYSTKLKNFFNKMDRAIEQYELEKGELPKFSNQSGASGIFLWYMKYIDPYMGHKRVDKTNNTVYFNDGSSLTAAYIGKASQCADFHFDINGKKKPNAGGVDKLYLVTCQNTEGKEYFFGSKNIKFGSYGGNLSSATTTRERIKNSCKSSWVYCSKLLEVDGWEYKPDYPYRIR